jgi:hypothetical protein
MPTLKIIITIIIFLSFATCAGADIIDLKVSSPAEKRKTLEISSTKFDSCGIFAGLWQSSKKSLEELAKKVSGIDKIEKVSWASGTLGFTFGHIIAENWKFQIDCGFWGADSSVIFPHLKEWKREMDIETFCLSSSLSFLYNTQSPNLSKSPFNYNFYFGGGLTLFSWNLSYRYYCHSVYDSYHGYESPVFSPAQKFGVDYPNYNQEEAEAKKFSMGYHLIFGTELSLIGNILGLSVNLETRYSFGRIRNWVEIKKGWDFVYTGPVMLIKINLSY